MLQQQKVHVGECEVCSDPCSFGSRVGDYLVCPGCKRLGPQETCANGCGAPVWLTGCYCTLDCLEASGGGS